MAAGKGKNDWSLATLPAELGTVAVGACGGGRSSVSGQAYSGGAISGSVVAVAILSAFGWATPLGGPLRVLALSSMGIAIGSVVGPDTFSNLAAYPASVALMSVCVV